MTHTISYLLFLQFYKYPLYLRKMFIFVLLEFFFSFLRTYFLRAIYIFYIFFGYAGYHVTHFRWFFLLLPRLVTCLLFLLFLSVSSYYLGHCSFSPCFSHSGNWDCTKDFLLIVWTVMLQNHYEGKTVKLYFRERLFVERMHQKKTNAETLCKIWFVPFVPWSPSSMCNQDGKWVFYNYHIHIYNIYI